MKKIIIIVLAAILSLTAFAGCGGNGDGDLTEDGKVKLNISNLYFKDLDDAYANYIAEKFNVSFTWGNYSWADWDTEVMSAANANNLPDVFHWNLTSWANTTYRRWIQGGMLKALPDDMSAYPLLSANIQKLTAINELKQDGELYCLPIIKNPALSDAQFSEFTYVYRRDWARKLGVYKEGDIYTFAEFETLLNAFKTRDPAGAGKTIPLADAEWAFPSVISFYQTGMHSYVKNGAGKFVWNYTTPEYTAGLNKSRELYENKIYWQDQFSAKDGDAYAKYKSGVLGCFFDNMTLANYSVLRSDISANPNIVSAASSSGQYNGLDEATALMRVKRPDNSKYVFESSDNWYSATMFSADMTDRQMGKVLQIMEWLLSEEGTDFCTYGFKDFDYDKKADGSVELFWATDSKGNLISKEMGGKDLRHIVCLNGDILQKDPLISGATKTIYNDFINYMKDQITLNNVFLLPKYPAMDWLSTPAKDLHGSFLETANAAKKTYVCTTNQTTATSGWDAFNNGNAANYNLVLSEINTALGL